MSSDLGTQLVARSVASQSSIQTSILKKAYEADQNVVELIAENTTRAPAPEGQGRRVDKLA